MYQNNAEESILTQVSQPISKVATDRTNARIDFDVTREPRDSASAQDLLAVTHVRNTSKPTNSVSLLRVINTKIGHTPGQAASSDPGICRQEHQATIKLQRSFS